MAGLYQRFFSVPDSDMFKLLAVPVKIADVGRYANVTVTGTIAGVLAWPQPYLLLCGSQIIHLNFLSLDFTVELPVVSFLDSTSCSAQLLFFFEARWDSCLQIERGWVCFA